MREEEKVFQNRRKVYKKLFRSRPFQRGQAFTELAAILIAICVLLLSVILFSVTGIRGVKNVILARENADKNLDEGIASGSGKQISHWINIGNGQGDSMHFTSDDLSVTGSGTDGGVFRSELSSTDGKMDIPLLSAGEQEAYYRAFDLAAVRVFFHAAKLTSGSATESNVLGDEKLYDAKNAMKKFSISTNIRIHDVVYMPNVYAK